MLHVALAVGDAILHIATRLGAKRVSLILADLEGTAGHRVQKLVEARLGKLAHFTQLKHEEPPFSGGALRAELEAGAAISVQ